MFEAAGWSLPSLINEHGGRTAYRITRENGRVRLEGRQGFQSCLLQTEDAAAHARFLLAPCPSGCLPESYSTAALLPAPSPGLYWAQNG